MKFFTGSESRKGREVPADVLPLPTAGRGGSFQPSRPATPPLPFPARRTDLGTSQEAAATRRPTLLARVDEMLRSFPDGLTDWEITTLLGEPDRRKPSISKRRQECHAVPTELTRLSPDGRPSTVWVLR